MKKNLLIITVFTLILVATIVFNPAKVFAQNGPSDEYCYIVFYNDKGSNFVYRPNEVNNSVQAGATYDKSTNTLTLNNLNERNLSLEVNEMGDDFKIKLVGSNSLRFIQGWGFGYGGSIKITGNGSLDVHAEDLERAILIEAESAACKLEIDSTATVNLYAQSSVISIYYTTVEGVKNAIKLPNATDAGTNAVKLPSGKTITFETETNKEKIYKSIKAFRPAEYASTYTIFTNSKDSQYVYGGTLYTLITSGGKEYENAWKIWRFIKSGDKYLMTSGEWNQYAIVEDSKLASSDYTKTGNTFSTYYTFGPENIEVGKDSSNKQYGVWIGYTYNSETEDVDETYYVYDIGGTVKLDDENVYVLTQNETVDGSKLTKTLEKEIPYYNYILPEKTLQIVPQVNLTFTDVKQTDWYYNAVKYVYENNIIKGYDSKTFAPNDKLTRGQLVTILHRMEGSPKITGTSKFSDVQDSSKYYYNAVIWATNKKIVSGYDNGKFGAEDNITREQLAVILWKYAKYKGKSVTASNNLSGFTDTNKISSWALTQVKWAVGAGVISGNANKTLNPLGNATRAEVAAMMEKYCKKVGR